MSRIMPPVLSAAVGGALVAAGLGATTGAGAWALYALGSAMVVGVVIAVVRA